MWILLRLLCFLPSTFPKVVVLYSCSAGRDCLWGVEMCSDLVLLNHVTCHLICRDHHRRSMKREILTSQFIMVGPNFGASQIEHSKMTVCVWFGWELVSLKWSPLEFLAEVSPVCLLLKLTLRSGGCSQEHTVFVLNLVSTALALEVHTYFRLPFEQGPLSINWLLDAFSNYTVM